MGDRHYTASYWEKVHMIEEPPVLEYRDQLRSWLDALPDRERQRTEKALRSASSGAFAALTFELFLRQYLESHALSVERHPTIPGVRTTPDFLVEHEAASFYLEATVGRESEERQDQTALELQLREALRPVGGPYIVEMTVLTPIPIGFPFEIVRDFLRAELDKLPGDNPDAWPLMLFESPSDVELLAITFEAMPSETDEDHVVQVIHLNGGGVRNVTTHESLLKVLRKKAYRYGSFDCPFVIAVGLDMQFPMTGVAVERALFGDLVVHLPTFRIGPNEEDTVGGRTSRTPTGFFSTLNHQGDPSARQVSAVAIHRHSLSGGHSIHDLVVLHHPYASCPLPLEVFSDLPQLAWGEAEADEITGSWTQEPPDWMSR